MHWHKHFFRYTLCASIGADPPGVAVTGGAELMMGSRSETKQQQPQQQWKPHQNQQRKYRRHRSGRQAHAAQEKGREIWHQTTAVARDVPALCIRPAPCLRSLEELTRDFTAGLCKTVAAAQTSTDRCYELFTMLAVRTAMSAANADGSVAANNAVGIISVNMSAVQDGVQHRHGSTPFANKQAAGTDERFAPNPSADLGNCEPLVEAGMASDCLWDNPVEASKVFSGCSVGQDHDTSETSAGENSEHGSVMSPGDAGENAWANHPPVDFAYWEPGSFAPEYATFRYSDATSYMDNGAWMAADHEFVRMDGCEEISEFTAAVSYLEVGSLGHLADRRRVCAAVTFVRVACAEAQGCSSSL